MNIQIMEPSSKSEHVFHGGGWHYSGVLALGATRGRRLLDTLKHIGCRVVVVEER